MFRYSFIADQLLKALTHKYIRRVPKGVTKTGATRYMYYYAGQEGHGKGVAHESELVQGASFAFGEHGKSRYHAHITKVDGDKLTIKYDDGDKKGKEETMTKKEFQALIHGEHSQAIKQAQSKAEKQLQEAKTGKERGVKFSDKTMSKLEERVKTLQGLTQKQEQVKQEEKKKTTPKKKETSKDDIIKNVTSETIGSVLNSEFLDCIDKDRERLSGINVNLESNKFEVTDGYVMKSIDFPKGFKVHIVGSKEFVNGTCCIPPALIKTMAKHVSSSISFNTDDYKITVLDKDGFSIKSDKSVGMDVFPDLDEVMTERFGKPDFTKNVLTFSESDRTLLDSLVNLGFSEGKSNKLKFTCKKNGETQLQIDAFGVIPLKFRDTRSNKIDSEKLVNAIQNLDGIKLDTTYKQRESVYLLRNKKTNELIGIAGVHVDVHDPKFIELGYFDRMNRDAHTLLSSEQKEEVTYNSHTVTIPTNIKSDVENDTTRFFTIGNIARVASSLDKMTIPKNELDASKFTNGKNMNGAVMPIRG